MGLIEHFLGHLFELVFGAFALACAVGVFVFGYYWKRLRNWRKAKGD